MAYDLRSFYMIPYLYLLIGYLTLLFVSKAAYRSYKKRGVNFDNA